MVEGQPITPVFVVLMGMPGAGKGTQAALLVQAMGFLHVSSGQIFRDHVARGTEFGKLAAEYMAQGRIGPDDVIVKMSLGKVAETPAFGYILDGVPRNLAQARYLDEGLARMNTRVHRAIYLALSEDEAVRRLTTRLACEACGEPFPGADPPEDMRCPRCGGKLAQRVDDNPETIRKRIQVYERETAPLVDHYQERGLLVRIDASAGPDAVHQAVVRELSK